VVSFTPLPLYPWGKSSWYPLDRRLGGPQSRSGRPGEVKILDHTGTRTLTPWSCSSYTDSRRHQNLLKSSILSLAKKNLWLTRGKSFCGRWSQGPRGIKRGLCSTVETFGSCVRIPLGTQRYVFLLLALYYAGKCLTIADTLSRWSPTSYM
jgi:hypothetical protein